MLTATLTLSLKEICEVFAASETRRNRPQVNTDKLQVVVQDDRDLGIRFYRESWSRQGQEDLSYWDQAQVREILEGELRMRMMVVLGTGKFHTWDKPTTPEEALRYTVQVILPEYGA